MPPLSSGMRIPGTGWPGFSIDASDCVAGKRFQPNIAEKFEFDAGLRLPPQGLAHRPRACGSVFLCGLRLKSTQNRPGIFSGSGTNPGSLSFCFMFAVSIVHDRRAASTCSRSRAMWAGPMRQHPPMMSAPAAIQSAAMDRKPDGSDSPSQVPVEASYTSPELG